MTYNEGLVEVGAQCTLLPVITDGSANGLGNRLLDGIGDPVTVLDELGLGVDMVSSRRRETGRRQRTRGGCACARSISSSPGGDLVLRQRVCPLAWRL